MKTIKLIDQIKASRAIYDRALDRHDDLSDTDLARVLALASPGTVARVLAVASPGTVDRVLALASPGTVDRALALASEGTVARVLAVASPGTVDRINATVPIVENLDQLMLRAVESGALDMRTWHCDTTHCRAGWAITFAGEEGVALERLLGPAIAARLIYEASTGRIAPYFYAKNEDAIADIRRCAGIAP